MRIKLVFIFVINCILILSVGVLKSHAEKVDHFVITGRLTTDDGKSEGTIVTVTKDGVVLDQISPPRSGRFRIEFDYNNEYKLTFSKEGFYKKIIVVSTMVPQAILKENSEFPPFQVEVTLVQEIPGIDKSFTNKPAGRVFYNANIDNFDSKAFFSDIQLEEQAQNARSQDQALTAEQREALAQREADYKKSITDANALYRQKKYEDALKKYQYAHGLFPDRPYPSDRMAELQDLIAALKIAEQRRLANEKPYRDKIAEADNLLQQQKYGAAKTAYTDALKFKPDDEYAIAQIAKAAELLKQQQIDKQYNQLIADAQDKFTNGDYQGAKEVYQQALALKPDAADFVNAQIQKIEDEVARQAALAEKEKQFNDLMDQGDKEYRRKKYDEALQAFQQALTLKPDDETATAKLAEVQQILTEQQNKANYDKFIADADQAMKNEDLTKAKSLYQEALKYQPDEAYPQQQIAAIDQTIASNQQFDKLVAQASIAEQQKDFTQAKSLLEQALQIKDDNNVRDQIDRINQQLAQLELDEKYADLIQQADSAKSNEDFENAKSLYSQALALKKNETYPKEQIQLIEQEQDQLAAQQKLDQQFADAMAKAENDFQKADYLSALNGFKGALALKPDSQQAKDRIDATNAKISEQQQRKQFDDLVTSADAAFKIDSLQQAKGLYQQALSILPDEQKPKNQIALIDQKIAQQEAARKAEEARLAALAKEKQQQYDSAIQKGDSLLRMGSYDLAKQAYQDALGVKPDEKYPKDQLATIKNKLAELAQQKKSYDDAVSEADKLAKKEQYEPAIAKYQEALKYLPDEEYPQQQIDKINGILAQLADQKQREASYKAAVQQGDSLFNLKEYETAKASYQKALSIKADEDYPKQKIKAIGDLLAQLAKEKQQYDLAIQKGDSLLRLESYDLAKQAYQEASNLKPDEKYPKDQLATIKNKLAELAQQKKSYDDAVSEADKLAKKEQYEPAIAKYQEALQYLPDEEYPQQQIDKINGILAQLADQKQREASYKAAVEQGDSLFNLKEYQPAKASYQKALSYKANEDYPKQKITAIDGLLAQLAKEKQQYENAIQKADRALAEKNFDNAKSGYNDALSIRPAESYPKDQLAKIDQLIQQKKENAYQQAIVSGDQLMTSEKYSEAQTAYNKALEIKPEDQYATAQMAKIKNTLAQMAKDKAQQQKLEKEYQDKLKNADLAFNRSEYDQAKTLYEQASTVKPGEQYPKEQIAKIDSMQQAIAVRQQAEQDSIAKVKQLAFDQKVQQGQQLEDSKKYQDAIDRYTEAKQILPDRSNDVDQYIQRVRDEIQAQKEREANYAAAIKQGDVLFTQEDWQKALTAYQEALQYKPDETYPQERVRAINQKLGKLDASYADAVKQADQYFKDENWQNAKLKYKEALGLKPGEQYPTDQLAIVNQKIQDQEQARLAAEKQQEIDQRYKVAIAQADAALNAKNYDLSTARYQKALSIKPGEQYPQDQLNKIEQLKEQEAATSQVQTEPVASTESQPVAQSSAQSAAYQQYIYSADSSYQQQNYKVAQFYYQKASQEDPNDDYSKKRLAEIRNLINKSMNAEDLSAYDDAIKQADKAFDEKHYSVAKFYYYKALAVKSWEQYPKDQIDQIEDLTDSRLSAMKEQEYKDLIAKADEAMVNKDYAVARAYYNRSLTIKTGEEYPNIKLKEISKEIQQQQADASNKVYQGYIDQANKAMESKDYTIARFYYQKALNINSEEEYPSQQLKAIKDTLTNSLKK